MFNINEDQGRIIRAAIGFAAACWLMGQIADAAIAERLWHLRCGSADGERLQHTRGFALA